MVLAGRYSLLDQNALNDFFPIAEKNNIEMQIGGFLESKIVFTANCHLAYQSDLIKNLEFKDYYYE